MKAQHVATQIAAMASEVGENRLLVSLAKRIFTEPNHARILANLTAELMAETVAPAPAPAPAETVAPAPAPAPAETVADTAEMAMFRQFQAFMAMQNGETVAPAPAPVQVPLAPAAPTTPSWSEPMAPEVGTVMPDGGIMTAKGIKYLSPIVRKIDHTHCPCNSKSTGVACVTKPLGNGFCASHGGKVDPNMPQQPTEARPR